MVLVTEQKASFNPNMWGLVIVFTQNTYWFQLKPTSEGSFVFIVCNNPT